jgi:probable rRNA maturation factor
MTPSFPQTATGPELDLAFGLEADLAPILRHQAGDLAAPLAAEARWQAHLQHWLDQLTAELPASLRAPAYSLGLEICGDAAIAELNQAWRHKPGATDVLAFAAQEDAPPLPAGAWDGVDAEALELGDIVISLETAARQAEDQGHGLERELLFLASHGLLHLLGWDHPDQASLERMLERQERLLA